MLGKLSRTMATRTYARRTRACLLGAGVTMENARLIGEIAPLKIPPFHRPCHRARANRSTDGPCFVNGGEIGVKM